MKIVVPQKGQKEQSGGAGPEECARWCFPRTRERIKREELRTIGAMNQVAGWLGLTGIHRVEAFDISNISGFESVGSMVVLRGRQAQDATITGNSRLNAVKGANDYASMRRGADAPVQPRAERRPQSCTEGTARTDSTEASPASRT